MTAVWREDHVAAHSVYGFAPEQSEMGSRWRLLTASWRRKSDPQNATWKTRRPTAPAAIPPRCLAASPLGDVFQLSCDLLHANNKFTQVWTPAVLRLDNPLVPGHFVADVGMN